MISSLDILRSKALKKTLHFSSMEKIFRSRSLRLLVLGVVALVFYFFACSYFPLWVLLIGPVLWGVPHLISSLRYNLLLGTSISEGKKLLYFQSFIWFFVFLYRISVDVLHQPLPLSNQPFLIEGLALLLSFFYQLYLKRIGKHPFSFKSIVYFGIFSFSLIATHFAPIQMALTLLIGHNYIPLITWYRSCQDRHDLKTFMGFTFLYITFSCFLFIGVQEELFLYFSPQTTFPLFNWSFLNVVESFGADAAESDFWLRLVSLYAFSQSIHYFLWLKAIPENYQQQQYPPSFRWSFQKLQSDFGASSVVALLTLVFVGMGYWLFFEFQSARLIYFALASYHGFMELSCLPFLKSNRPS